MNHSIAALDKVIKYQVSVFMGFILFLLLVSNDLLSQEKMEIGGAIVIEDSESVSPAAGTIRWNGNDFEGWNGLFWVSLTGNSRVSSVIDIDNNTYKTVRIGNKVWMAENLKVRKFSDGRGIPGVQQGWDFAEFSARCAFDNDEDLVNIYGYLYNWYAVDDGKLCPNGWHVPSDDEWQSLIDRLGGALVAGAKLKSIGFEYWEGANFLASNEVGFTALPGGFRRENGEFVDIGYLANWWSSTAETPSNAWIHRPSFIGTDSYRISSDKRGGYSIRCVKD